MGVLLSLLIPHTSPKQSERQRLPPLPLSHHREGTALMNDRELPDIALLRQLLVLDKSTGTLFWARRDPSMFGRPTAAPSWNTRYAGREAFTAFNSDGYKVGKLFNKPVRAHIVVYAMVNGEWPDYEIDHANGVRTDNRPANLRAADRLLNMRNRAKDARNSSGATGVSQTKSGRWSAIIGAGKGSKYLGTFDTFDQAREARLAAEKDFGYDPAHGKR